MARSKRRQATANESGRSSRLKATLEIVGGIVAIVGGLVGVYIIFRPVVDRAAAQLEIVEFAVTVGDPNPIVKVKLRNAGGSVAFVSAAEITLDEPTIERDEGHYAAEVVPVLYDWLLTGEDIERRSSALEMSRKIEADDVDSVQFSVGMEPLKSRLTSRVRLRLKYNQAQEVVTDARELVVDNFVSRVPRYMLPKDDADLILDLKRTKAAYTRRQIIEELDTRNLAAGAAEVKAALDDSDVGVRSAAAAFFESDTCSIAADRLVAMATSDPDPHVRQFAGAAVVRCGLRAEAALADTFKASDPAVREQVVVLLADGGGSEELLLAAFDDRGAAKLLFGKEVLVAAAAIRGLARRGSHLADAKIVAALDDDNESVRLAAIDACRQLDLKDATSRLREIARSPDSREGRRAAEALKALTAASRNESDA
jgi:hypothetical protein